MQTGDPDVLKRSFAEVSDIIQYMMEDESNRPETISHSGSPLRNSVTPSPGNTPVGRALQRLRRKNPPGAWMRRLTNCPLADDGQYSMKKQCIQCGT